MAEDTATLVRKLKIDHADFFGYSMGAGIALELAVQYPQLVRGLLMLPWLTATTAPPRYRCAAYGNRHRWVKIGRERASWRGPVHG